MSILIIIASALFLYSFLSIFLESKSFITLNIICSAYYFSWILPWIFTSQYLFPLNSILLLCLFIWLVFLRGEEGLKTAYLPVAIVVVVKLSQLLNLPGKYILIIVASIVYVVIVIWLLINKVGKVDSKYIGVYIKLLFPFILEAMNYYQL